MVEIILDKSIHMAPKAERMQVTAPAALHQDMAESAKATQLTPTYPSFVKTIQSFSISRDFRLVS
jgi:hypothetical protein